MTEGQMRGKQLVDGEVAEAKLESVYTAEVLKRDGSVAWTGNHDGGGQRLTNLGAPTIGTDGARLQDIFDLNRKEKCRSVTTVNDTLSGLAARNGITPIAGDRWLVPAQTLPQDDGIYIAAVGAWTRSSDADSTDELTGAVVFVNEGTTGADTNYQQLDTITTVGTTPQNWIDVGGANDGSEPVTSNKDMAGSVTATDGDQATATALASTPAGGSFVGVYVNGLLVNLGNGVLTEACYFSNDAGTSARTFANIAAGDTLHWNGTIALYELDATDRLDFLYDF